ncbi:MAG: hypothetical protein GXC76_01335 [Rhodanobacteraceae bacterium]|jgi:cytoskeletal protein RodZ|nr:hypothetical protein [Rhodanobacteraceae bacterium]
MNPHERDDDLQHLLGDDGGEFGRLYRRLPRSEPPRRLDRSVLGEAARAVLGHAPRRHRWLVGLGSFAGLALAAGVAWHVGQIALQREETVHEQRPVVVPVQPISAPRHPRATENAAPQPQQSTAAPAATAPAPAPAPPATRTRAPSRQAAKPAAPPAPPPAPTVQPEPFPAGTQHMETAPPAATEAAPTPAEAPAKASRATTLPRGAAPSPSSSLELRRDLQLAPAQWLARIRQLMHEGRRQQASESLRLFRRVHPNEPLPDDLRPLLGPRDE